MAHCLRQLHQHGRARRLLEDLLDQEPDPNIRAMVITESLASGASMLDYLIEPTIVALGLAEEKTDLRRVADALMDTGGDSSLDELATCDAALDHCPAVADQLALRAGAAAGESRAIVRRRRGPRPPYVASWRNACLTFGCDSSEPGGAETGVERLRGLSARRGATMCW